MLCTRSHSQDRVDPGMESSQSSSIICVLMPIRIYCVAVHLDTTHQYDLDDPLVKALMLLVSFQRIFGKQLSKYLLFFTKIVVTKMSLN